MLVLLQLLAEGPQTPANPQGGSPFTMLLPLVAIAVLFYFLMVRPMKRQEADRKALINALKKNDRVVTSGGIIGVVSNINEKDEEVTLKVDESSNVRLRVTRPSIVRILSGDATKTEKEG
jgi:preprotein translocase subunit YajC